MKKKQIAIAAVLASSLMVQGCATNGSQSTSDTVARCATLGIGGALLGALTKGKDGAIKGALTGLAACALIEVASSQTRTAAEVEKQYRTTNGNELPVNAKLESYSAVVSPTGVARSGETVKLSSVIRAVAGVREPISELREVLTIYAPSGEEFKRAEKRVAEGQGSGEYANSFTLRLPQGAPQGVYRMHTQVYLNGKVVAGRDTKLQLAAHTAPVALAMN
jgi:hypothetical protein